jgi:hypothetical protein
MVISAPQTTVTEEHARASVSVELESAFSLLPETFPLWYEVPVEHRDALSTDRGDAFVVGLLFLAMRLPEDIEVRAPMSPQLLRGLREYQRIFSEWFDYLQAVEIEHDGYASSVRDASGTGTFFSGGVDSFFTLRSHLEDREPISQYQITHGLFIDGFDTKRPGTPTFDAFFEAYDALFDGLGLTLLPVRTNLKTYINNETTGWRCSHGAFLMSIPLVLQQLLGRCYVPSSFTYSGSMDSIAGTNPMVDHLLSTGDLEIVHDGAWAGRVRKTEAIASWPATRDHLYVCFDREGTSLQNCCRCEKCIRTMIALDISGQLSQYSTFTLPLERRHVRGWEIHHFHHKQHFLRELKTRALAEDRADLTRDLRYVMWKHRLRQGRVGRLFRRLFVEPAKRSEWISTLYERLTGSGPDR